MAKSKNTAVGYVRVSTDDQADSGLSLAHQETRIRAYCEAHNLELVTIVADEGVSAGKPLSDRKGGAAVLQLIAAGAVHHVVALKLDRVFRDAGNALAQSSAWDKAGVGLHLIDMGGQSINTRLAMGRMFFVMSAGFAEMERGLIRERTAAAMRVKKERGEVISRPTLGFDAVNGKLVENAAECELISRIIALHKGGASYNAIARQLKTEGVPTKRGGSWQPTTIRNLILRAA
jgi:DNA invertase Pin-like site-specific DNA recombinase